MSGLKGDIEEKNWRAMAMRNTAMRNIVLSYYTWWIPCPIN